MTAIIMMFLMITAKEKNDYRERRKAKEAIPDENIKLSRTSQIVSHLSGPV
jgi:hypothetical protein